MQPRWLMVFALKCPLQNRQQNAIYKSYTCNKDLGMFISCLHLLNTRTVSTNARLRIASTTCWLFRVRSFVLCFWKLFISVLLLAGRHRFDFERISCIIYTISCLLTSVRIERFIGNAVCLCCDTLH
jgi:hypothetical protein